MTAHAPTYNVVSVKCEFNLPGLTHDIAKAIPTNTMYTFHMTVNDSVQHIDAQHDSVIDSYVYSEAGCIQIKLKIC